MRRLLQRAHIWLGWIVGVQLVLWTLSGLLMTVMPIEGVRGEHLKRVPAEPPLAGLAPLLPPEAVLAQADAEAVTLKVLDGRPVYLISRAGRPTALFDARSGAPLRLGRAEITRLAAARFAGEGAVLSVERVDPTAIPLELRRDDPAWRVRFSGPEGAALYLHAVSGELLAVRTDRWRLFDFMWGLHIMAPREREDMNHPVLVGAAALALLTTAGGMALLVLRARRRRAGASA